MPKPQGLDIRPLSYGFHKDGTKLSLTTSFAENLMCNRRSTFFSNGAGPDSEEYSTRNEASSCLRNAIERNPLGGMRSPGNEGAGPTDRYLRVQRSRRDQRLSRRPTAQHQSARTVIDHRFRQCLSCGKHVSIPDDHQATIRPHRQTMHRSDSRSAGRKSGPELLHSSHTACRTRKLRIAITAVTCNGTQNQLPRSTHAYAIRLCHKHLLLFTR